MRTEQMTPLRTLALLLATAMLGACASAGGTPQASAPDGGNVVIAAVDADYTEADTPPSDTPLTESATASVAATPPSDDDASPADAEDDFAAIYGQTDASGQPISAATAAYDPWEKYNRKVHAFNSAVDRGIAKPLAQAYVAVVPRPLRIGVGNFFDNLGQPVTIANSLLQGSPRNAANALGRFLLNSTLGIGGLFDVASKAKMPDRGEDFGQTLAVWGWQRSRYVEVPFLGPRTLRDLVGLAGDTPLRPVQYLEDDKTRVFLQGLQAVDLRARLLAIEGLGEGAVDEYALFRDIWLQRRNYHIQHTGGREGSQAPASDLPPYLLEEEHAPAEPVPGG